jgi:hypothetical protein
MPTWIDDEKDYRFRPYGQIQETRVFVSGVMDDSGEERPKVIFEEHPENKGRSVLYPEVTGDCIQSISGKLNIEPDNVDWFIKDKEGNLKSIQTESYLEKQPDPEYQRLVNTNEFADHAEAEKAKKYFPDIETERLRTTSQNISQEESQQLDTAFNEAKINRELYNAMEREHAANQTIEKSAHEYDLSQERFGR